MSQRIDLLTPVGRFVMGSLYEGNTTDAEKKPLTHKNGALAGKPRTEFYFALAIEKGKEQHWAQTEWGAKIWEVGQKGFPNGQANSPTFAWKIKDGDSTQPNRVGKRPCDQDGFPGHWILNFTSGFAPNIYNADGTQQILEVDAVNLGDYIQVFGTVASNESQQQPGIYLNHQIVAFAGYGKRIYVGIDAKAVGFGKAPLPSGVSPIPLAQGFNPAPAINGTTVYTPAVQTTTSLPTPYPQILNAQPLPSVPAKIMTAKANGAAYEAFIAQGWTDELLIQHGYLVA